MTSASKSGAVAARVRGMIHAGTLREDDPLPSTRRLADELGVSRGTVVAAYEQLDGEGYIRTRHGTAARVAASAVAAEAARAAPTSPTARPDAQPALVDLRPGIPAVRSIAARDWRAAWRAAANAPLRNALSDPAGTADLREQIAAQLGLTRGFAADPADVVVSAGTSEGLSLLAEALRTRLGRPPRIVVEDPGYRSGRRAMAGAGAVIVGVPVGDDGIDLDRLEELARAHGAPDAVVVTPTHQYPLGSVMPVAARRRLLAWAAANDVVVVEDDYDSEFRHRGTPPPALAALDAEGVVVHTGGFSKVLDPRLRCAYLVLPGPAGAASGVAEAIRASRTARGPVVSEPTQDALAHLLRTGALRRHLGRVRRDYTHRRDVLARRVARMAHPGLEAHALTGGLHAVLTWPAPAARTVRERLADAGYLVEELAAYAVTEGTTRNGIVLGYAAVTEPELDRALDALDAALRAASD